MNKLILFLEAERFIDNIKEFFIKYRYVLAFTILIGIISNSIDIFTYKYGIDSELYAVLNHGEIYFETQRYGSYILNNILPLFKYSIISHISGIIFLSMAVLLIISRHNISITGKTIFCIAVITFPVFAQLQYFFFQSVYNFFCFLLVVISYRLAECGSKYKILYIPVVVLLVFSISSYQSLFAVYLTIMMINIILDYIDNQDFKNAFKNIIILTSILLISIMIYYIIIKLSVHKINNYHAQFLNHFSIKEAGNIITAIYRTLMSNIKSFPTSMIAGSIVLIFAVINFYIKEKSFKKLYKFLFLIFLLILAGFSIRIIFNGTLPLRAYLSYGVLFAGFIVLGYIFAKHILSKILVFIIVCIAVLYNINETVKFQNSYIISYEQDSIIAEDILNRIYKTAPEMYYGIYKVSFIGKLARSQKHHHPVLNNNINVSFFAWDNGNPVRMLRFLQLKGLSMETKLNMDKEIIDIGKNMPAYPDINCVKLYKDTVIVKLQ